MLYEEETYRKVESLFGEFLENAVSVESFDEKPTDDTYRIHAAFRYTMKDGTMVEIVFWSDKGWPEWGIYDIAVDQKAFDETHEEDFEEYMRNMGLYTENVKEGEGEDAFYWEYGNSGLQGRNGQYRLQYVDMHFWG